MARLRKFICYRGVDKAYTRFSKYKKLSYVRARPVCKVVRFDMGDFTKKYDFCLHLVATARIQIRDNAIESARQSLLKPLEKTLGKTGFFAQVRIYPHHVLRENPLASGAGADRLSTGMAHSFGKTIGIAAQVNVGQPLFSIFVNKENLELAQKCLQRASHKLPSHAKIITEKVEKKNE